MFIENRIKYRKENTDSCILRDFLMKQIRRSFHIEVGNYNGAEAMDTLHGDNKQCKQSVYNPKRTIICELRQESNLERTTREAVQAKKSIR